MKTNIELTKGRFDGEYTSPTIIGIGSVNAVIVDPHEEVFSFWHELCENQTGAVIHVDKHRDMTTGQHMTRECINMTRECISRSGPIDVQTYAKYL